MAAELGHLDAFSNISAWSMTWAMAGGTSDTRLARARAGFVAARS